jgi:hypothetical protein
MAEFVGVIDPYIIGENEGQISGLLKQSLLIFNRVAIPNLLEGFLKNKDGESNLTDKVKELHWLLDNELLFESRIDAEAMAASQEFEAESYGYIQHTLGTIGVLIGLDPKKMFELTDEEESDLSLTADELDDFADKLKAVAKIIREKGTDILESDAFKIQVSLMTSHLTRMNSISLREAQGLDAYPVLSSIIPMSMHKANTKSDVIRLVLNSLPVPDELTPWEYIIEYRSDPDSYGKFLALRNWMSEISRQNLPAHEVEDKLEYLLYEYRKQLELHKIKAHRGTLEAIVIASAEFLEDIANKKFTKLAQGLFTAKQKQIELLEGELTAAGREVAYIVKAQDTF